MNDIQLDATPLQVSQSRRFQRITTKNVCLFHHRQPQTYCFNAGLHTGSQTLYGSAEEGPCALNSQATVKPMQDKWDVCTPQAP